LICPICDQYNEDDWHIIFHCNDSILASQSAGLEHVVAARLQQYNTVKEVISSTVSDMVFVFLYCEIWWNIILCGETPIFCSHDIYRYMAPYIELHKNK
jgi:hypothetical protein